MAMHGKLSKGVSFMDTGKAYKLFMLIALVFNPVDYRLAKAEDYPDELPIGAFKITTPDGLRYIPELVINDATLLEDFGNTENSAILGSLKLSIMLGDENFHKNFAQLNANREANSLPKLELLQPFVNLKLTINLPDTQNPFTTQLVTSSDKKVSPLSVEINMNKDQIGVLDHLASQADWLPWITVSTLINGKYEPIQILEPHSYKIKRNATDRTLRILPAIGHTDDLLIITVGQIDHNIEQIQNLKDTALDFPGMNSSPTSIQCAFAADINFPNHYGFDFDSWKSSKVTTFSLPLGVRSAIARPERFSDVPTNLKKFIVIVFDDQNTAQSFFLDKPVNTDQLVKVLAKIGTRMENGLLIGYNKNGDFDYARQLLIPNDLGAPTFDIIPNAKIPISELTNYFRKKLNNRVIQEIEPNANKNARDILDKIANKLNIYEKELKSKISSLDEGQPHAIQEYCSTLDQLRQKAISKKYEGFKACSIISSVAFNFNGPSLEEKHHAIKIIADQLENQLLPSKLNVENLIQRTAEELIKNILKSDNSKYELLSTESTDDFNLMRDLWSKFPFLSNIFQIPEDRFAIALSLVNSRNIEEENQGVELLEKNIINKHLPSIELLAEYFLHGTSLNMPDVQRAFSICKAGVKLESAACNRILGIIHKNKLIENIDPQLAFSFFEKAASHGDKLAMIQLGHIFRDNGQLQNFDQALEWYSKAADSYPEAMTEAAMILKEKGDAGFLDLLKKSAENNYAPAQYHYAMEIEKTANAKDVDQLLKHAAMQGHALSIAKYSERISKNLVNIMVNLFKKNTSATEDEQLEMAIGVAQSIYSTTSPNASADFIKDLPIASLQEKVVESFLSSGESVLVNWNNRHHKDLLMFKEFVTEDAKLKLDMALFEALLEQEQFDKAFSFEQDLALSKRFEKFKKGLFGFKTGRFINELSLKNDFEHAIRLNKLNQDNLVQEHGWMVIINQLLTNGEVDRANDIIINNLSGLKQDELKVRTIETTFITGKIPHSQVMEQIKNLQYLPIEEKHRNLGWLAQEALKKGKPFHVIRELLKESTSYDTSYQYIIQELAKAHQFDNAIILAQDIPKNITSHSGNEDTPFREAVSAIVWQYVLNKELEKAKILAEELSVSPIDIFSADEPAMLGNIAGYEIKMNDLQSAIESTKKIQTLLSNNTQRFKRIAIDISRSIPKTGDINFLNKFFSQFIENEDEDDFKTKLLIESHTYARRYSEADALFNTLNSESAAEVKARLCEIQLVNNDINESYSCLESVSSQYDLRDFRIKNAVSELLSKQNYENAMKFTSLPKTESERTNLKRLIYNKLALVSQTPEVFAILQELEHNDNGDDPTMNDFSKIINNSLFLFDQAKATQYQKDSESFLATIESIERLAIDAQSKDNLSIHDKYLILLRSIIDLEELRKEEIHRDKIVGDL